MLKVFALDGDEFRRMSLPELAELLRPLLQPAPADVPDVPTPDWSKAPEWAQWWAMDEIGLAWWYEQKPECCRASWESTLGHYKEDTSAEQAKSYLAWRDSLAQRPATPPTDARDEIWAEGFEAGKASVQGRLTAALDRADNLEALLMTPVRQVAQDALNWNEIPWSAVASVAFRAPRAETGEARRDVETVRTWVDTHRPAKKP